MPKQAKKNKAQRQQELRNIPEPKCAPRKATGEIVTLEVAKAVTGSVVAKHWKQKAGKTGVWRADKLDDAVRSAFLSEGSKDVEPAAAARIATDKILAENHLDAGRWSGLNAGMLSMNLRNVLRGLIRNDGLCMVYGKKIA